MTVKKQKELRIAIHTQRQAICYLSVSYVKVLWRSSTIISLLKTDGEGVALYFHLTERQNWPVRFT